MEVNVSFIDFRYDLDNKSQLYICNSTCNMTLLWHMCFPAVFKWVIHNLSFVGKMFYRILLPITWWQFCKYCHIIIICRVRTCYSIGRWIVVTTESCFPWRDDAMSLSATCPDMFSVATCSAADSHTRHQQQGPEIFSPWKYLHLNVFSLNNIYLRRVRHSAPDAPADGSVRGELPLLQPPLRQVSCSAAVRGQMVACCGEQCSRRWRHLLTPHL